MNETQADIQHINILHIQKSSIQTNKIAESLISNDNYPLPVSFTYERVPNILRAQEFMESNEVDAILLKIRSTSYSNLSKVSQTREIAPELPIIVICDNPTNNAAQKTIEAGADDYLNARGIDGELIKRSLLLGFRCKQYYRMKKNADAENLINFNMRIIEDYRKLDKSNIDKITENLIQYVGEYTEAEICRYFEFDEDTSHATLIMEWNKKSNTLIKGADNFDNSWHKMEIDINKWWMGEQFLDNFQTIEISNVEMESSLTDTERKMLTQKYKGCCFIEPVLSHGVIRGFLVIANIPGLANCPVWKNNKYQNERFPDMIKSFIQVISLIISVIYEKNENENTLRELADLLRLINKILRHDILNSLTVIHGVLNMYQTSKDVALLDTSNEAIERSIQFIDRMKEFEKSVLGGSVLRAINLRGIVEKSISSINIPVEINGDCVGMADDAIESVFNNIIRNAVVHGETKKITINLSYDNNEAIVKISDYGIGIPKKYYTYVFDEGFKFGDHAGTGLGLFIVKKTIERYGGSVSIAPNDPSGTTVIIRLEGAFGQDSDE